MGFNQLDREWMDACVDNPDLYNIAIRRVRNPDGGMMNEYGVNVIDNYTGEILHQFTMEESYFLKQLLDYIGVRVTE